MEVKTIEVKIFITLLMVSLYPSFLRGQFEIQGKIKGFENQKYTLEGNYGMETKVLGKTQADSTGAFRFSVVEPYTGVMNLRFSDKQLFLFSDNSDIRFFIDRENKGNEFQIYEGISQKIANELGKDDNSSKLDSLLSKHPDSFTKYYIDLRENLITIFNSTDAHIIENAKGSILKHFTSDGKGLERSGLFKDLIIAYLIQGNKMKIDDSNAVLADAEKLLTKVGIDSQRGQIITKGLIDFLDRERYGSTINKIVELVDCSKCSLPSDLKYRIIAIKKMKKGKKVPDIVFETPNKEKKSIFKVKAKYKIIMFWASWCVHCRTAMPGVLKKYPELKEKKAELFAVSADTDKKKYEDFSKNHPWYKYIDYKKWDSPVFLKYDIRTTPTFVLVDKKNRLIGKYSSLDELEKQIK